MKGIQYDASIVHKVHDQMIKDIHRLQSENARLREALEYLMEGVEGLPALSAIAGVLTKHYNKAQQALKGDDTCKP